MQPINFDEIDEEEKSFTPLPEGVYTLTVEQVEEKQSNKGNEFWSLEFSAEGQSKKIWDSIFFTENTLGRVKRYFKCLGVRAEGTYTPVTLDLIGKKMNASLKIEEYTDKNGDKKLKNTVNIWESEPVKDIIDEEKIPF